MKSTATQSEAVLTAARDNPGSTAACVASLLGVETIEVSTLMSRLHKAGKVRREGEGGKLDAFRYFMAGDDC